MYNALNKIKDATYTIEKTDEMLVPGLVITTEELINDVEIKEPLQQIKNVAELPSIVGYSIAMPDLHWGYGFPIGGVAGFDLERGVISPGGVGYDINCGVRLAIIPEEYKKIKEDTKKNLLQKIFDLVPSGVGRIHKKQRGLSDLDYKNICEKGAKYSVDLGFGLDDDLEHIENSGFIDGASLDFVTSKPPFTVKSISCFFSSSFIFLKKSSIGIDFTGFLPNL